jgi:hypothetical protein
MNNEDVKLVQFNLKIVLDLYHVMSFIYLREE